MTDDAAYAAAHDLLEHVPATVGQPDVPENHIGVHSPRGNYAVLQYRSDTSDLSTIGSTFWLWGKLHDEYGLRDVVTDGLLIDVGAHIGSVAIAFLLDNPKARAIAVEPLPENVEMIERNADSAGVRDRLTVMADAIGAKVIHYGFDDHRYIGNIGGSTANTGITVETVTLAELVATYGVPDVIKVDCEGCEWPLFRERAIRDVPRIVGEFHSRGAEALVKALGKTHVVTILTDGGGFGTFRAVKR